MPRTLPTTRNSGGVRLAPRPGRRAAAALAGLGALGVIGVLSVLVLHGHGSTAARRLSSAFAMRFDNLTYHSQAGGTLTAVTEDRQGRITGTMTVNAPLYGTGPVTGTREDTAIRFAGTQNGRYEGTLSARGELRGTYTYPGQHGEWRATPLRAMPARTAGWPPWWLWLLLALAASVLVTGLALSWTSARRPRLAAPPSLR